MKTKFQNGNLVFEPENIFWQQTGRQAIGKQFSYRLRQKWSIYEIDHINHSTKYIGSMLTSPRDTKIQIVEQWNEKSLSTAYDDFFLESFNINSCQV